MMNNYLTKQLYNRRKRKAVSPVISTIIIVAIAIAISIAVALYLTGVTSTFTRFERLDVTSAYANPLVSGNSTIELSVKNSGTSTISIDRILLNGRPTRLWTTYTANGGAVTSYNMNGDGSSNSTITMSQGDSGGIKFGITGTPGQSVEISFHTVSGKEYPKVVVLP